MNRRIKLHIGSIEFALVVDEQQEHLYREAQRVVNRTYDDYIKEFPKSSIEEIWALVALRVALNYRQIVDYSDLNPVLDKIDEINQKISNVLTNEEQHTS